ncbi:hypothetical protein CSKR_107618 [Clonorchis sinensis]|uniref:Uncharacterized protein n=1 Tax=Clonorchis sinensis TaxID=79923 RepID=A0A419PYH8_CLOSI|nr:hypothetical protein CSKR_107618 [Clonorchis sinensis]
MFVSKPNRLDPLWIDMSPTALELILRISISKLQILRNSMQPTAELTVLRMTSYGEKPVVAENSKHDVHQSKLNKEPVRARLRQRTVSNGLFRSLMITIIGRKARSVLVHEQMRNKSAVDVHKTPIRHVTPYASNTTASGSPVSYSEIDGKISCFSVPVPCEANLTTSSLADYLNQNTKRPTECPKRPGVLLTDISTTNPKQFKWDTPIVLNLPQEKRIAGICQNSALTKPDPAEANDALFLSESSEPLDESICFGIIRSGNPPPQLPGDNSVAKHTSSGDIRLAVLDGVSLSILVSTAAYLREMKLTLTPVLQMKASPSSSLLFPLVRDLTSQPKV